MEGLNIVGLGSLVTGDASAARVEGPVTVTLSPEEIAKRVKAEKRAAARATAKGKAKLATEDRQYQAMCHEVAEAIRSSETEARRWFRMAPTVIAFYGNGQKGADAFESARAAFSVDAIVKGLSASEQALWHTDIPRKGTKDETGFPDAAAKRKAREDLARKVAKYWGRIFNYAYPKDEAPETPKTPEAPEATGETGETGEGLTLAKFTATVATLLKQVQASDGIEGLDIVIAIAGLEETLTAIKS